MALAAHRARDRGATGETAGTYLKAAGIGVRPPGAWGTPNPVVTSFSLAGFASAFALSLLGRFSMLVLVLGLQRNYRQGLGFADQGIQFF